MSSGVSPLCDTLTFVPLCDHALDCQPHIILGIVEARSVNVKNIHTVGLAFILSIAALLID